MQPAQQTAHALQIVIWVGGVAIAALVGGMVIEWCAGIIDEWIGNRHP